MAKSITGTTGDGQDIDIRQPYLTTNYVINVAGEYPSRNASPEALLGSVAMFGGSFAPNGWEFCKGQTMKISENESLFAILGSTYGGNGRTTFKLPDLRGRVPIGVGDGPGLKPIELGKVYGSETATLIETPEHLHSTHGTSTGSSGRKATLSTMMPSLGLNPIISVVGKYPERSLPSQSSFGDIVWFAGKKEPQGWRVAEGDLLAIARYESLFSLLGTTFGGDGRVTFALPDLRGRIAIGTGYGHGLSPRIIGSRGGQLEQSILLSQIASHQHTEPDGDVTATTGNSIPISIEQPWLALNFKVHNKVVSPGKPLEDQGPNRSGDSLIGTIRMSGYNFTQLDTRLAHGQPLLISQNKELFSLLGTTYGGENYGGDGHTTFNLPDYAGRAGVGENNNNTGNLKQGDIGGAEERTLTSSQLPAHSHSEPSLSNMLGLTQESTATESEFTLKKHAVVFEPFINNGMLTNTSTMSIQSSFTNKGTLTNNSFLNINKNGKLINEGKISNEKGAVITNDGVLETSNGSLLNQGTISGSGTLSGHYIDQGKIKPGNSTGGIKHHGNFIKDKGVTIIELAGHKDHKMNQQKTKHDFLHIHGDAQLGGRLKVKLIEDYILAPNKKHKIIEVEGKQHGRFKNYSEGDMIKAKNHAGEKIFISYEGGDGNDVILFTKDPSSRTHLDHQSAMSTVDECLLASNQLLC